MVGCGGRVWSKWKVCMCRLVRAKGNRSPGTPCDVNSEDLVLVHDELVGEAHGGNSGAVLLGLWVLLDAQGQSPGCNLPSPCEGRGEALNC
eukprot:4122011-Amphidinium_carterae.1